VTPKISDVKNTSQAFLPKIEMRRGTIANHPIHPRSYLGKANVSKVPEKIAAAKGYISLRVL